jgi:hypothetical protein
MDVAAPPGDSAGCFHILLCGLALTACRRYPIERTATLAKMTTQLSGCRCLARDGCVAKDSQDADQRSYYKNYVVRSSA